MSEELESDLQDLWKQRSVRTHEVDFGFQPEAVGPEFRYEVVIEKRIPKSESVLLYFPGMPEPRKRVYEGKGRKAEQMHKDIHKRLAATLSADVRVGVYFRGNLVKCKGIVGRFYLLWASHVSYTMPGGAYGQKIENVPVLFQTVGGYEIDSLTFLLPPRDGAHAVVRVERAQLKRCRLHWPTNLPLVLDVSIQPDPALRTNQMETREEAIKAVVRSGRSHATEMTTVRDPFADTDVEDEVDWLDDVEREAMEETGVATFDGTSKTQFKVTRFSDGSMAVGDISLARDAPPVPSSPRKTPRYLVSEVSVSGSDDAHTNLSLDSSDGLTGGAL